MTRLFKYVVFLIGYASLITTSHMIYSWIHETYDPMKWIHGDGPDMVWYWIVVCAPIIAITVIAWIELLSKER